MRILWLDLNSSYSHSSLALPALHSQLEGDAGCLWSVVPATVNEAPDDIVSRVYAQKPDVIAATCWLFNRTSLLSVLSRCKVLLPEATVILGGPEFLGENETFLRTHPFVNAVFRGEGERAFPKWLSAWNRPEEWTGVEGLCWLDEGFYRDNGLARVLDFAELKAPQESRFYNWSKAFVQFETTRGCFNTCAFCVSGGEKPVRALPMDEVRRRLVNIHDHGIRDVRMLDRTFNYDNRRAMEMLDMFTEFYPDMRFHLEVHPALLNPQLKEKLASMPKGLLHVEAGIQSLHEEVLKVSRRAGSLAASLEGLKFLCSLDNLIVHADLIAGLPLYGLDQIFSDVCDLASFGVGEIQLESLKVLPGTEMRRRAQELGIRYAPETPYEVLATDWMGPDQLRRAMYLSRMLDFYYNTEAWQNVFRNIMLSPESSCAGTDFLNRFLDRLISMDVISTPLSLEKRGVLLHDFCKENCPEHVAALSVAWIESGMSLKKSPAGDTVKIRNLDKFLAENGLSRCTVETRYGNISDPLRFYWFPLSKDIRHLGLETDAEGYLFGFDADLHQPSPVFSAVLR